MQILCKEGGETDQILLGWHQIGFKLCSFLIANRGQGGSRRESEKNCSCDLPAHPKLLDCSSLETNIFKAFSNRTLCQITVTGFGITDLSLPPEHPLLPLQAYWWNIFAKTGVIYEC